MELSASAKKVQQALNAHGLQLQVVELPASTRTAGDAAQAIGCQVGQIVKSLVFHTVQTRRPVLILVSGSNRVDEIQVGALLGEAIGKADADFVRQHTGFAIGGVPPLGHLERFEIFIDSDLLQYQVIWAAAGTPNAVFRLTPADLLAVTDGRVVKIS